MKPAGGQLSLLQPGVMSPAGAGELVDMGMVVDGSRRLVRETPQRKLLQS